MTVQLGMPTASGLQKCAVCSQWSESCTCVEGEFFFTSEPSFALLLGQSLFSGLDHWTGLLDWNTGLTFDPKNSIQKASFSPL